MGNKVLVYPEGDQVSYHLYQDNIGKYISRYIKFFQKIIFSLILLQQYMKPGEQQLQKKTKHLQQAPYN